ncbi:hypothetical protein MHBO_000805 [Bonamia ostreae]|uniref:GB1/RHD3-type G domain-containing protein n=1 Tax=Bonamia ostreae TaxID=126728 RepID=A0ABV2AGX1_9EUKA
MDLVFALMICSLVSFGHARSFQIIHQEKNGEIKLNHSGLDEIRLRAAKYDHVKVISVIGPYRTGKSFLLNILRNGINFELNGLKAKEENFQVGSTVQPCTLGVWAQPEIIDGKFFLFLDTTGLFSPATSEQSDARLLAIISLLSSKIIYNHFGVIDASEISRFSFIVRYTKSISGVLSQRKNAETVTELRPDLLWLSRDFYLDLKDDRGRNISATEWLKSVLGRVQFGKELNKLFYKIKAFTLPFPSKNVENLKNLDEDKLSDEFKSNFEKLRNEVILNSKDKIVNGKKLSMAALTNFVEVYSLALNEESAFSTLTTVNSLLSLVKERLLRRALEGIEKAFKQIVLPVPKEHLRKEASKIQKKFSDFVRSESFGETEEHFENRLENILSKRFIDIYVGFSRKNEMATQEYVNSYIDLLVEDYRAHFDPNAFPIRRERLLSESEKRFEVTNKKFVEKIGEKMGSSFDFEDGLDKLESKLKKSEKILIGANQKSVLEKCEKLNTEFLGEHFSEEKIEKFYDMGDFEGKTKKFLQILSEKCFSEKRQKEFIRQFYTSDVTERVKNNIERAEKWHRKVVFACFLMFAASFVMPLVYLKFSCFGIFVVTGALLHTKYPLLTKKYGFWKFFEVVFVEGKNLVISLFSSIFALLKIFASE